MNDLAIKWDESADRNSIIGFIDTTLRGAGQVMLQNNPLTGLLFLVGITWGAIDADMGEVAIGAIVGLLVATVTAILLSVDDGGLRHGMYGFNGILVGVAAPTFLDVDGRVWVYIIVGAAVSTVAMLAIANVFKTWDAPALTFPFVLTTWFLVLGASAFSKIQGPGLSPAALPAPPTAVAADVNVTFEFLIETLFRNISQVFLINNVATGVIFVVALAVSSRWGALFALGGSALAIATALTLGADASSITGGLFGFSAVLTAVALGTVFFAPIGKVVAYTVLAVIFTVIVQGALDVVVEPWGIPTFTAPFVFVTWLFLLPKERFDPIRHDHIVGGAVSKKSQSTDSAPVS